MKYSVRLSGYKDYVALLFEDKEIMQHKTNSENFDIISCHLNKLCKAVNEYDKLKETLKDNYNMMSSLMSRIDHSNNSLNMFEEGDKRLWEDYLSIQVGNEKFINSNI